MTGTFKSSAVIAEVRKIAAEQPDFNYSEFYGKSNSFTGEKTATCVYFDDDCLAEDSTGKCIVGKALENLGVDSAIFTNDFNLNNSIVSVLDGIIEFESENDRYWLREVQLKQDDGSTWGDAVEAADEYAAGSVL